MHTNTISTLGRNLRMGREHAFEAVFDQYHRLLYVLALRHLRSGARAEDAVQHTFVRLWEHHDTLDFSSGVRSLLVTIMKNHILNELRHDRVVMQRQEEMMREGDMGEDLQLTLDQRERMECLRAAIDQLPPQKRQICLMKMDEGLSNQDIADRLDIAVTTVKSHYTQALHQLRTIVCRLVLILFAL